jgi:hypothetical protein
MQPSKQPHRPGPEPSQTGQSPFPQCGKCGLCSQNTDATGSGLPHPARHGQNERVIALNRKNALFAGSDGGGEHWAVIASLIETAKLSAVEPFAYLHDVLQRMLDGYPANRLDDLLPWNWRPAATAN